MQNEQQTDIIYSVTDGISSFYTKREYLRNFRHFLNCSQLNPESLVKQAKDNPRHIESLIINHIRHLAEIQKLTHKSIHIHCYAIFHFLEMNDITTINKRKIKRFAPPDESSRDDRAYTHEEIAEILLGLTLIRQICFSVVFSATISMYELLLLLPRSRSIITRLGATCWKSPNCDIFGYADMRQS